jgi:hypothetical protein
VFDDPIINDLISSITGVTAKVVVLLFVANENDPLAGELILGAPAFDLFVSDTAGQRLRSFVRRCRLGAHLFYQFFKAGVAKRPQTNIDVLREEVSRK